MQNTSAGELQYEDASIELVALDTIAKFKNNGVTLTQDFLVEFFETFFAEAMGSPEMEAVSGMPAEIMAVFYNDRASENRARYAQCVARAFETWEAAARANRGVGN